MTRTALGNAMRSRTIDPGKRHIHLSEAGDGPALLLVHGSGPGASGLSNYSRNIDALARNFRVLMPDTPGYGASSKDVAADDPKRSFAVNQKIRESDFPDLYKITSDDLFLAKDIGEAKEARTIYQDKNVQVDAIDALLNALEKTMTSPVRQLDMVSTPIHHQPCATP